MALPPKTEPVSGSKSGIEELETTSSFKQEKMKRTIELPPDSSDDDTTSPGEKVNRSIVIRITLENITAGTAITDSTKIKLLELMDKGVSLEIPTRNCAKGHHVAVHFICEGVDPLLDFIGTGKIESLESFKDGMDQIKIKLVQYPEDTWHALHHAIQNRQAEIGKFLKMVGGRE